MAAATTTTVAAAAVVAHRKRGLCVYKSKQEPCGIFNITERKRKMNVRLFG